MIIFRWLSLVLIVLAVMLLGADLIGTLEKKVVVIRSLQDVLILFNYDTAKAMTETFPSQVLGIGIAVISWPGWATLSVLAILFGILAPSSKRVRPLPPPPPIPR